MHIDDGRSFLATHRDPRYDLIVYALVDSLVLHSGYSTVRLESFLFTREAFEDIKARLKPDGVFAAYNAYRQGWVVGRLQTMMTGVFGDQPLVMGLPYAAKIAPGDPVNSITFILGGGAASPIGKIRRGLEAQPFWINDQPRLNELVNGFGVRPPPVDVAESTWHRIGPSAVEVRPNEQVPVDDWPFLYLRDPVVPTLNIRGMVIIAALSAVLLYAFAPAGRFRPNWQMFFMGAGFMLLETKSVVHLALLFGSTWMVNSIVVFAILVMILCSNLFVLAVKPARVWPFYALLALALLAGIVVPMSTFLNLPGTLRILASCAVVFLPIFFAGIVFATAFRDSSEPDIDFGSNIAGAVLGGLSESLSLMIGFNHLLVVALLFYVLPHPYNPGHQKTYSKLQGAGGDAQVGETRGAGGDDIVLAQHLDLVAGDRRRQEAGGGHGVARQPQDPRDGERHRREKARPADLLEQQDHQRLEAVDRRAAQLVGPPGGRAIVQGRGATAAATSPTNTGWNRVAPPPISGRAGEIVAMAAKRLKKSSSGPEHHRGPDDDRRGDGASRTAASPAALVRA